MSYDSYRPGLESHAVHRRRISSYDGGNDSMSWRRDTVEERRASRRPDMIRTFSADSPPPRINTGIPADHRITSHARQSEPPRLAASDGLIRPAFSIRGSSATPATNPTSPPASRALSSRSPVITKSPQLLSTARPRTAESNPVIAQSTDPRLKIRRQPSMAAPDMVSSPAPSSTDDGQDTHTQGGIMKVLVNTIALRNETKKEHEQLRIQVDVWKEELTGAQNLLSNNRYTEKLSEDIKTAEKVMRAKKAEIEKLKQKEETAIRALDSHFNNHDATTAEMQHLRAKCAKAETDAKRLTDTNDGMSQQIASLASAVNVLTQRLDQQQQNPASTASSNQRDHMDRLVIDLTSANEKTAKTVEQGMKRLAGFEHDLTIIQGEDMEVLRADVKQQKLAMARLNDVFVTHEDVDLVCDRVKILEDRSKNSSATSPGASEKYIQQADLDRYITVFNAFQTKIEDRLNDLPKSEELAAYAKLDDLNAHVYATSSEAATRADKMKELEAKLSSQEVELAKRIAEVQQSVRNAQPHTMTLADSQQLVRDVKELQLKVQPLDDRIRSNRHTIMSLTERYNNINTEEMAVRVAITIEPMLATLYPRVQELEERVQEMLVTQNRTRAEQASTINRLNSFDARFVGLTATSEGLRKEVAIIDTKVSGFDDELQIHASSIDQKQQVTGAELLAIRHNISNIENHATQTDSKNQSMKARLDSVEKSLETKIINMQASIDQVRQSTTDIKQETASLAVTLQNSVLATTQKQSELERKQEELQENLETAQCRSGKDAKVLVNNIAEITCGQTESIDSNELTQNAVTGPNSVKESIEAGFRAELESFMESTGAELTATKQEMHTALADTVEQVKATRDDFNMRLTVVENAISIPQVDKSGLTRATESRTKPVPEKKSASTTRESNPPTIAQSLARAVPVTDLPRKNPLTSTTASRAKSSQASPLARHFQPRSETDDEMSDTIDATPKPRLGNPYAPRQAEVVTIADSDQERETSPADAVTQSPEPAALDLSKWQKDTKAGSGQPGTRPGQKSAIPTPTKKILKTKRKRDSSNAGSSNGRASGDNRSATPRSAGRESKKKRTVDE